MPLNDDCCAFYSRVVGGCWCDDVVVKTDFVALEERVVDTVTVDKPLKD